MKNFLILLSSILSFGIFSQTQQSTPPCWWTPDWDWMDATPCNYYASMNGNVVGMGSPFASNNGNDDVIDIVFAGDYLPQQGWLLLFKDFGCPTQTCSGPNTNFQDVSFGMPFFILYNKYRGIMRMYLYVANFNQSTGALTQVEWNSPTSASLNNGLFTHSNPVAQPNNQYPKSNNAEKFFNYINQFPNTGGWVVTEYLCNFDGNTNDQTYGQLVKFTIRPSQNSTIALTGNLQFTTQSATAKTTSVTPTTNSSNPNLLDYTLQAKDFMGKVPKKSELQNIFNDITTQVNNIDEKFCNNFTLGLHNANQSLQNGKFKKFLLGAADVAEGVGGALGVAAKILDLFMNKSNTAAAATTEQFVQPTISKGTLNLNGTMTTEFSPKTINMQLPGTKHKDQFGNVNYVGLPFWDCGLGVLGLEEAPTIQVKTWTEPVSTATYNCVVDFSTYMAGCDPSPQYNQTIIGTDPDGVNIYRRSSTCPATYRDRTVKSYRVLGDVKLALNDAAGVTIVSQQAALVFEILPNSQGQPSLDILKDTVKPSPIPACCNPLQLLPQANMMCPYNWNPANGNSIVWNSSTTLTGGSYSNLAKDLLNKNILQLSNFDNATGLHRFQTAFIDIDKFKNTAITIEGGTKVYLKIFVIMKPTDPNADQTPITYVATYDIPAGNFVSVPGNTPYPMTCEEQAELTVPTLQLGAPNLSVVLGPVLKQGVYVSNTPNGEVVAYPQGGTTEFKADVRVTLAERFYTDLSAGGNFRAHIAPTGQCISGGNALVVNHYQTNCNPDPEARIAMYSNDRDKDRNEVEEPEVADELKMHVIPNPNDGNFNLAFNRDKEEGVIEVRNLLGELVISQSTNGQSIVSVSINQTLPAGVYLINYISDKGTILSRKFVKQ